MEDIQQSEIAFYLPVIASYGLACAFSLFLYQKFKLIEPSNEYIPSKPWKELLISLLTAAVVIILGRVYAAGYLFPSSWGSLGWFVNNVIIYSPLFVFTYLRKQPSSTLLISTYKLPQKLGIGLLSSVLAVLIFIGLRGEWNRIDEIISRSFSSEALNNFFPVFMEGIAVAYLFVRLKWVSKLKLALLIPSILFALAHVPGMIAEADPWWHIILMSLVTGSISAFVLYTCNRTKDIIWLGLVHYFVDVAIRAF